MTLIQYLLIPFTLFGIFLVGWLVKAMIELFKAGRELDEARNKYMRILTQKAWKDYEQWQKISRQHGPKNQRKN